MDRTDMLIVESNCHNPDVNMLFDQYTLIRIEYLIGCDRVHGKTKKNDFFSVHFQSSQNARQA